VSGGARRGGPFAVLLALALGAAAAALYWPAMDFGFTGLDDEADVRDSGVVALGFTPAGVRAAFTSLESRVWIPLTTLSLQGDVSLGGISPRAFHRTNILLFAASCALLLLLFRRLLGNLPAGAFAAALFAFHPLRVESVAWIVERKDVLSLLFLLLALAAHLRWVETRARGWMGGTAILFACSLAAKPSTAPFPFLLLALDLWPLERLPAPGGGWARTLARLAAEKVPLFLLSGAAALGALLAFARGAQMDLLGAGGIQRALLSPFLYVRKTFWPSDLHLEFFHPSSMPVRWEVILAAALAHAGILLLLWRLRGSRPWLLAGWCWFLFALLPVGGILFTGGQWLSDRFTLVPHLGLALALAREGRCLTLDRPRPLVAAGAAVLLLALSAGTRGLLPAFRDGTALMERTLAFAPGDARARRDYALSLERKGRVSEALSEFGKALALPLPPSAHAWFTADFAAVLRRAGRREEAATLLREAVAEAPFELSHRVSLGQLLVEMQRPAEAVAVLQRYLPEGGNNPVAGAGHIILGRALLGSGRREEAVPHLEEGLRLDPGDRVDRLLYARLLLDGGRAFRAGEQFARVAADPGASPQERAAAREGMRMAGRGRKNP